jgi:hypothetical protein
MFRSLVEHENKRLSIFHDKSDNRTADQLSRYYQQKLRLNSSANIRVFLVDNNRVATGMVWFENILNELVLH